MRAVLGGHTLRTMLIIVVIALIGLLVATPVRAATPRGGETVVIGRDEVVNDDLYVAASTIVIDGTVNGDVIGVGNALTINGTVNGDVLVAGQTVTINGAVSDDVRAAGQFIVTGPSARVGGDLVVGALSLENQSGSTIQGDVLVGAYQALLSGNIGKRVLGGMTALEIRGSIGGDVDVEVAADESNVSPVRFVQPSGATAPEVARNLTVADSARIGGRLIYRSPVEGRISPQATIGSGVAYTALPARVAEPGTPLLVASIQRLIALLLVGLLLLLLLPTWTRRLADTVEARPLPTLGWGFVAALVCLVAVIGLVLATIALAILFGSLTLGRLSLLIIGLGGLANATLVVGYLVFVSYVAPIVLGYLVGRWALLRTQPSWAERPYLPLALGLIVYVVLGAIPVLGPVVGLIVTLLGLGALWELVMQRFQRPRAQVVPPLSAAGTA